MKTVKKYLVFLCGLYINSMGISLITKAGLGTSPGSGIPYVLSMGFVPTMGQFTIAFNFFLIFLQVILRRKEFEKIQYLQIGAALLFGYFLDFSMSVISWLMPEKLPERLCVLAAGCIVLGFGVFLEVRANVIMLPGEGFVKAVSIKLKKEFGITKVWVDASMTVMALVISLVIFRRIRGIGAGTVIAALITGLIANAFTQYLEPVMAEIFPDEGSKCRKEDQERIFSETDAGTKWIITIGREYGCGAAKIGKIVAEKLGISCYDSELVDMVAQESGLETEYVRENQEKLANGFLYDLYKQTYAYTNGEQTRADALHDAEVKVIRRITEKESCVIIGRMANYVLEEHKNAFHVFLYAPMEYKKQQVMEREHLSEFDAECRIRKVEQERSNCYRQYAKKDWGRANSYDLTVNTGLYDSEKTADIIIGMLKASSKNTQQPHDATAG
ncbi:MAG: cytidylate kinase family protein [Lachnospiraceae bacterium]|nr:cytidylate kinase family protein [Lachnospiraceae bacterium]